jgi:cytochrome c-type biogenesis protein CcsB
MRETIHISMLFNLENFIENLAFCLLFLTMLFYWIAIGSAGSVLSLKYNLREPRSSLFLSEAISVPSRPRLDKSNRDKYTLREPRSLTGFFSEEVRSDKVASNFSHKKKAEITSKMSLIARSSLILANASLFVFLLLRWKESGHFPLSNLYESLVFLSWSLTFIQIFIENKNATKSFFQLGSSLDSSATLKANSSLGKEPSFIGAIIAPSALLTYAFATFSLPTEMQKTSALVPALQSNWLVMHVTIMILSYASLICGCLLSIAFLIITRNDNDSLPRTQSNLIVQLNSSTTNLENNLVLNTTLENNIELQNLPTTNLSSIGTGNIAKNLDNLSYRILGIGFPLLTIGILSGSVWANEAWGSYWSWDPKETWALLTWLVFAIYLHTRLTKGWEGKKPAIIASFGFIIVWVCFIGVNLLGKGLHSYGWLS